MNKEEFTEADLNEALKDPKIKKIWDEAERFQKWFAMQLMWLQKAVDEKMRKKINHE